MLGPLLGSLLGGTLEVIIIAVTRLRYHEAVYIVTVLVLWRYKSTITSIQLLYSHHLTCCIILQLPDSLSILPSLFLLSCYPKITCASPGPPIAYSLQALCNTAL